MSLNEVMFLIFFLCLGFVRVFINNEANRLKWKRDRCLTQEMLNALQVKAVLRRLVGETIVYLGFNPR